MMAGSSGKVALIAGITGQDGAYLALFLLGKGYVVHGTSRDAALARLGGLIALGICDKVVLHSMSPADFQSGYGVGQSAVAIGAAMLRSQRDEVDAAALVASARRFDVTVFDTAIRALVDEVLRGRTRPSLRLTEHAAVTAAT